MGALSGNVTTTAYYVDGEVPEGFRETFVDAMNKNSFTDIDLALDHDESMGWVSITDPFDSELTIEKFVWGDYLMAAIRHDVVRLPATAFKFHLQKALAERREKEGRERLTKAEIDDTRDFLERQLKKRVLPSIKTHDLVWNVPRKELWFWTTNKKVNELFVDLFEDTFQIKIYEKNPYSRLERMEESERLIARALEIEPSSMAAQPSKGGA